MWDLIVSVPDHCLSFYFISQVLTFGNCAFMNIYIESVSCWSVLNINCCLGTVALVTQ